MDKENKCRECECATRVILTPAICPGLSDGYIQPVKNCSKYKSAPMRLTVTQAAAYASYVGVPMSRPTIIKISLAHKAAQQIGSKWTINAAKFRKIVDEKE